MNLELMQALTQANGIPSMEDEIRKIVVQEQFPQILRMHTEWHARRIRIPRHKVGHRSTLPH